jgi:hypothetical protein
MHSNFLLEIQLLDSDTAGAPSPPTGKLQQIVAGGIIAPSEGGPSPYNHPKSALWIHGNNSLKKGLEREKKKPHPHAAVWSEVSELCFNQKRGNLIRVKDPDNIGKTKVENTYSYQWIIDPVPVKCAEPPTSATQVKLKDAWPKQVKLKDAWPKSQLYHTPIYACVGNGTDVTAGHIISGLSKYSASAAYSLQCSINGGERLPRKISLRRNRRTPLTHLKASTFSHESQDKVPASVFIPPPSLPHIGL